MNPTSSNPNNKHNIRTRFTLRFLRTLKQVNSSCKSSVRRSVEIKHAANLCMAATVGSKRAWSRAMLSKIRRRRRRRFSGNPKRVYCREGESETRELRGIVPGGEDLDTKRLLEETAHYIKCLGTQVEVMKDILRLYSSSS